MTTTTDDRHGEEVSSSMDLYLTSDERFQVWEVKAAERPHLLTVCADDIKHENPESRYSNQYASNFHHHHHEEDEEKDDENDDSNDGALPLTDGCDIPGWRRARIGYSTGNVMCNNDAILGALCIGQGCALMRRETQLPVLSTKRAHGDWKALQAKLLNVPPEPRDDEWKASTGTRNILKMIRRISYQHDENAILHAWFERENVPVLLEGCMSNWPAMETCRWDALVRNFGSDFYRWRFSDTHGETMSLKTYDKYVKSLEGLTDDSPLAVYDSQFHTDDRKGLLKDYQVPSCFDTDLFALLDKNDTENNSDQDDSSDGEEEEEEENEAVVVERPPYRWILMGPERSGTGLHVDPVGTHAWVSLIQGCKRWVLFPPDTCRKTIGMMPDDGDDQQQLPHCQIPSVLWFRDYYEKVCSPTTTTTSGDGERESSNNATFVPGAVHVVQRPGETVYVPAGWPHLVLNLEASVAITENYATEYPSMDQLWKAVEEAEPALAVRFREALEKHRPELAAQINVTDIAAVGNKKLYVSMPTTSNVILKSCGEEEGMSQSENEHCHGCRVLE